MARITYVKHARQRYVQVPVLDENGNRKRTPVMLKNGQQKVTKHGRPVFMDVTADDKSRPLNALKCEQCGKSIDVGMPYKHVSPKSGPYGGRKRIRCMDCPTWQPWELSNSLSALIMQATADFDVSDATCVEDVQSALEDVASQIRDLAEQKRESASNIESGFGHSTYVSDELNETADTLDSWADEIENADVPDYPEAGEVECDKCNGDGEVDCEDCDGDDESCETCEGKGRVTCDECEGNGTVETDDPTDEQISDWLSEVEDAVSIVNESPF